MHYLATAPQMPGFLNALSGPLNHYGYLAVFFLVMVEDFGVPVPGETILIAAAIYAGNQQLNIVAVGLVGFIAAVIGDNIGFAIGHFGGRALALRWGKYVFLTEERLNKAEVFFDRHGGKIIVVARFIEGLRQANGIIAGITGMHWRRFAIFNAIGAALWVGTWVSLGYLAGNHIDTIYRYITNYSAYVAIALVIVIAALIVRRVLRHRRRTRATASETAASETAGETTSPADPEAGPADPEAVAAGPAAGPEKPRPGEGAGPEARDIRPEAGGSSPEAKDGAKTQSS
jgi:membrane protein DedA with SNARE-associated domain